MVRYILLIFFIIVYGCKDDQEYKVATSNSIVSQKETNGDTYKNIATIQVKSLKPQNIAPSSIVKASGVVKDMVYQDNKLYVATDNGSVDILKENLLVGQIKVPEYKDNLYDENKIPTIFSFDTLGEKSIMVRSDETSNKSVYFYQNGKVEKLNINGTIVKARFVDNNKVIFGLLSSEIVLFDLAKKQEIYRVKVGESSLSDMSLDVDKKHLVVGVESGVVYLLNILNGNIVAALGEINRDKTFRVGKVKNLIFCANQDGTAKVIDINKKTYQEFNTNFLVYSGAISPKGDKIIFSINENGDFIFLDILKPQSKSYLLANQKSTPNISLFVDNNTIYTSSDDEHIAMWKIPK